MKRCQWLVGWCALLGGLNLFGQTPPQTAQPVSSVSATVVVVAVGPGGGIAAVAQGGPHITDPATPPRAPIGSDARITNLSTRARIAADSPLITGFALTGNSPRTVLLRAIGPTLGVFGVSGTLSAPHLKLHDASGAVLLENAGWGGSQALVTASNLAGAFPLAASSADSVAVATLAPGTYSIEVNDDAGRGGVVLTEIYDVNGTADGSRLANVSTRNNVAADGGEFISGFTISGTTSRQFLLRGVGPGLAKFGVTGVLSDPVVTIYDSAGRQVANNDDWTGNPKPGQSSAVAQPAFGSGIVIPTNDPNLVTSSSQATGAFALDVDSRDAALVTTLTPGAYTVQMRGASVVTTTFSPGAPSTPTGAATGPAQAVSGTGSVSLVPAAPGIALLEIYEVP